MLVFMLARTRQTTTRNASRASRAATVARLGLSKLNVRGSVSSAAASRLKSRAEGYAPRKERGGVLYPRTAKPLPTLVPGQTVHRVRNDSREYPRVSPASIASATML